MIAFVSYYIDYAFYKCLTYLLTIYLLALLQQLVTFYLSWHYSEQFSEHCPMQWRREGQRYILLGQHFAGGRHLESKRFYGMSTYGHSYIRKGDKQPAYSPVKRWRPLPCWPAFTCDKRHATTATTNWCVPAEAVLRLPKSAKRSYILLFSSSSSSSSSSSFIKESIVTVFFATFVWISRRSASWREILTVTGTEKLGL